MVVAVDVPDDALHEDFVFVHGYERAEHTGGELLEEDGIGRPVALEYLVRDQIRISRAIFDDLLARFAEGQSLGLGEEVGEQHGVVFADCVWGKRVLRLDRRQEIAGDQLRALVDELIKCMLAIGAGFAPDDWAGLVVNARAVAGDVLAVGLHVALLEIGGKTVHVLVVGQDGHRLGAEEVIVPDAQ